MGGITVLGTSPDAFTVGALDTKQTVWRSDDEAATYGAKEFTRFDHLVKPDIAAPGNRIRGLLVPGTTLTREHLELIVRKGVARQPCVFGFDCSSNVTSS